MSFVLGATCFGFVISQKKFRNLVELRHLDLDLGPLLFLLKNVVEILA